MTYPIKAKSWTNNIDGWYGRLIVEQDGGEVAAICMICPTDGTLMTPEQEANARLIAAAPDLLAACEAALIRLDYLNDDATGEHSAAYCSLVSAIAKAKGRDS